MSGLRGVVLLVALYATCRTLYAAEGLRGHHGKVSVSAPTRLDWIYALANQSLAEPPPGWLDGYESTSQTYELDVPAKYHPRQATAAVIFISAGAGPAGWNEWKQVCQERNILFASPFGAGNDCPMQRRVRIVFDVLDDLRRNYNLDPDRTYLAGFSGGGRVAAAIAFALPEYFGGVIPVCASGDLRDETWLRHRAINRLSVALLTGENDFNRGELERFRGPLLKGLGVDAKVWVYPGLGHGIPGGATLGEVFQFLDAGAARRKKLAQKYPASRIENDAAPTRAEWAQELLDEAKLRLKSRQTQYSGLMQIQGVSVRWADLPAGKQAREILEEYDARENRPWDADDVAEQRTFLIARARALDAYASGPLPQQYAAMRGSMLQAAINLWELVINDGQDADAVKEARKRLPELKELLAEEAEEE